MAQIKNIHVITRTWLDKVNGNTYFAQQMKKQITKKIIRQAIYNNDITALYRYFFMTNGRKAESRSEMYDWVGNMCNATGNISRKATNIILYTIWNSDLIHFIPEREPKGKIKKYFAIHDIIKATFDGCKTPDKYAKLPFLYTIIKGNEKINIIAMCSPKYRIQDYNKYTYIQTTPRDFLLGEALTQYRRTHFDNMH